MRQVRDLRIRYIKRRNTKLPWLRRCFAYLKYILPLLPTLATVNCLPSLPPELPPGIMVLFDRSLSRSVLSWTRRKEFCRPLLMDLSEDLCLGPFPAFVLLTAALDVATWAGFVERNVVRILPLVRFLLPELPLNVSL